MMETFGPYLIKASVIILIFWMIYRYLLQKETTFVENRYFLLAGLPTAILLPLFKIKQTVMVTSMPNVSSETLSNASVVPEVSEAYFTWDTVFFFVYISGCLFLISRFIWQLYGINRLKHDAHTWREEDVMHVEATEQIAPFSFFKHIYYYPKHYNVTQLEAIITHEKVHAKQWHSMDVICSELLKILLWFNPLVWNYQKTIQQNLEFLADAHAVSNLNKKSYQYLMVQEATGHQFKITNSFYNSLTRRNVLGKLVPNGLVKKRIVMLNKNRSKQSSALKSLFILPLLTIFLVSFSTEKVYEFSYSDEMETDITAKSVELIIDKNTTDKRLVEIKNDLAKDGVDFSYTAVRNDDREIIDIAIEVTGKGENGASFRNTHNETDEANGISTLVIFIDIEKNLVSIGTKGAYSPNYETVTSGGSTVWVTSDGDEDQKIVIRKKNGKNKIFIDGEELEEADLHQKHVRVFVEEDGDTNENFSFHVSSDDDEHKKQVHIKKGKSKKGKHVVVLDDDDDHNVEFIGDDEGIFFIDTEGKSPLYIIDGKESSKAEMKKLSPKDIATIDVSKGKSAVKKYGKKAKNGVVEIVTKKK